MKALLGVLIGGLVLGCMAERGIVDLGGAVLTVTPRSAVLPVGATVSLAATPKGPAPWDAGGTAWSSRNTAIAQVSDEGRVEGVSRGTVYVVATRGSHRDSALVQVLPARTPDPASRIGSPEGTGDVEGDADGPVRPPRDPTGPPLSPATDGDPRYPNEPKGFAVIAASSMEQRFGWPQGAGPEDLGRWWHWEPDGANTEILAGAGVPGGPRFNRTRFEAGRRPGTGPVSWGAWDGRPGGGHEYEEIYFSKRIRLLGQNWESQRVGTKLGFFGVGRDPRAAQNDLYLLLQGGVRPAFSVRAVQQNAVSRSMRQNRASGPVIRAGRWHHWELYMKLNDPGTANGTFKWWVDGRLIIEYHDVVYRTDEHPHGFLAYKWNPTWGGSGGPPKARDDFIDISEIRISGAGILAAYGEGGSPALARPSER